jgi:hypothetical protein
LIRWVMAVTERGASVSMLRVALYRRSGYHPDRMPASILSPNGAEAINSGAIGATSAGQQVSKAVIERLGTLQGRAPSQREKGFWSKMKEALGA